MGIDTLVVAGLTTECCIDSSVRDAFERDYHVFVVGDATACYEPGLHQRRPQGPGAELRQPRLAPRSVRLELM